MAKSKFLKTGLLLLPGLIGVVAKESHAQAKKPNLKSVMVLEHGTSQGHRASSDDLNNSLKELGAAHGFQVKVLAQSVNLDVEFSAENLAKHQVVIFSNNDGIHKYIAGTARNNFQKYVEDGGGLLAVHASSAWINGWTWLDNALVQKFYGPHQSGGPAADLKQDADGLKTDTETRGIAKDFTAAPLGFIDEYYQFQATPRGKPGVTVLLTVDERTPGANFESPMGADHPVTWVKTVGKGRVVHNSLGHSFKEKGHNAYTQKSNYLKNFTYTSLRYAAGDFIGCTDNRYSEYNPDATKSDPSRCVTTGILVQFNKDRKQSGLPLVSQNEAGTLVNVEFFQEGPNAITITDVTGKQVYRKTGSGQVRHEVPTPKKSGIYIVKAKAGGMESTHRVTVL